MIRKNPYGDLPKIDKSGYVDPTALIIGKVKIGRNVFIGPGAIIRADEPKSSITIGNNCNIQDRVIIHALGGTTVKIGDNVSLSHGCIIHGPCKIGKQCFIGFGAVIFKANLCEKVFVKSLSVIEGADIPCGKIVTIGMVVDSKKKVRGLGNTTKVLLAFSQKVVKTNLDLVKGYRKFLK